jgi:hypothetical protein
MAEAPARDRIERELRSRDLNAPPTWRNPHLNEARWKVLAAQQAQALEGLDDLEHLERSYGPHRTLEQVRESNVRTIRALEDQLRILEDGPTQAPSDSGARRPRRGAGRPNRRPRPQRGDGEPGLSLGACPTKETT